MSPNATTVRLDPKLKKAVMKLAVEDGFTLTDVIKMLLRFYAEGSVNIGVTRYPKAYADMIKKEASETRRLYRQGKIKGYTSAKEMMDDILNK
jgi:antitoxin component of RelBE/YafQ-DinJ toxin-antitoxin module